MNSMNTTPLQHRGGGPGGGRRLGFTLLAPATIAMAVATFGLLSQPAAASGVQLAQLVCDSGGCGAGASRATPPQGPLPRPYYSGQNAEEKRALQERDRMRRERRERGEASQR